MEFGAKTIYFHRGRLGKPSNQHYEERITVFRSRTFDTAIMKAEAEARAYARSITGCKYLGFVNVYKIPRMRESGVKEVFSLMRESTLYPDAFLKKYHADGSERVSR